MYHIKPFLFIVLLFVLGACTSSNQDRLTGKKWVTAREVPWGHTTPGRTNLISYVCEFKSDSLGVFEWMEPRIEWDNDTVLTRQRNTFTYYRKGKSLYVKDLLDRGFREQYIRELTDSTLVVEIPDELKRVVHYTALNR